MNIQRPQTFRKVGGSLYVPIPADIVNLLQIKPGDELWLTTNENGFIITIPEKTPEAAGQLEGAVA